ncbi:MAG: hypothetical protein AAGF74_03490 [Pseudomonadota bacterium]
MAPLKTALVALCLLAFAACAPNGTVSSDSGGTVRILRCNISSGGSFATGLQVRAPGFSRSVPVGQDGLTSRIASNGDEALAWAVRTYPELAGAQRYSYSGTCGVSRESRRDSD